MLFLSHVVGIGVNTLLLAVEANFFSDMVVCLPLDPAAQVRFPPQAVGILLHPVAFGGQYVRSTACVSDIRMECPGITIIMCDQQRLRQACAKTQSDQSLC